ncbi:gamma-glutamyl-gamma-aminobutyrate hydrolase family protein [Patescibacteria group bacterium]
MSRYITKIGITCSYIPRKYVFLPNTYVRAIVKNGGRPYLIPVISSSSTEKYNELIKNYIDSLDGFLFSGGGGVATNNHKFHYKQKVSLKAQSSVRYHWEKTLLIAAINNGKSILGICRGHQMLATYLGLKLTEFKKDHYKTVHSLSCVPDTHIAKILNSKKAKVNSSHKQCVLYNKDCLGNKFRASMFSKEKYVETLESVDGKIITTQFHPERMKATQSLFKYFIDSSRKY